MTNTGSLAGKDVLEVFSETPYDGRVEKVKKMLAGFEKTRLLAPRRDAASHTKT